MNKKNIKKIVVLGFFCVLLLAWIGVKVVRVQIKRDLNIKKENTGNVENNKAGKENTEEYYNDIFHPGEGEDTTFADQKSAELLKMHYEVKNITITKDIEEGLAQYIFYPGVEVNNGKIINNWSLAVITVNVKNNQERKTDLSINTNQVKAMKGEECVGFYEAFYMYPFTEAPESKSHFRMDLEPDEEREVQVYYILEDKYLDDAYTLYYSINPAGLSFDHLPSTDDDSTRFFANIDFKDFINE